MILFGSFFGFDYFTGWKQNCDFKQKVHKQKLKYSYD